MNEVLVTDQSPFRGLTNFIVDQLRDSTTTEYRHHSLEGERSTKDGGRLFLGLEDEGGRKIAFQGLKDAVTTGHINILSNDGTFRFYWLILGEKVFSRTVGNQESQSTPQGGLLNPIQQSKLLEELIELTI